MPFLTIHSTNNLFAKHFVNNITTFDNTTKSVGFMNKLNKFFINIFRN